MSSYNKTDRHLRRKNRVRAKISGTAERPRLSVFKSNEHHFIQLIDDVKGVTLVGCSDITLKKTTKKMESAMELGKIIAKLALEKGITTCVFDRGGHQYHGRVKAIAEGAREGGLKF